MILLVLLSAVIATFRGAIFFYLLFLLKEDQNINVSPNSKAVLTTCYAIIFC